MKRTIFGVIMSTVIMFSSVPAFAATTEVSVQTVAIAPRAVSTEANFSCAVGKSWQKTFDMNKIFASDHNAFKAITSGVSGKYKVIVNGDDGFAFESKEYNGTGCTLTITNAKSSVDYTVTVVNTGSSTCSGKVKVSSYYNS